MACMRPLPLSLFLKLAAAAATAAAALMVVGRFQREGLVAAERRSLRTAVLRLLPVMRPPAILVAGFHAHGKSSFVNTVCRCLAGEQGPLIHRAEAAPPGLIPATLEARGIHVAVEGEEGEGVVLELVDSPPLPEPSKLTRADVESAISKGRGGLAPPPECVVVVVRCGAPAKDRYLAIKKLTDISSIIRERGLHLVVVLTQKKALRTKRQAEELRREVALRTRTDCVYFVENYTATTKLGVDHPPIIKNDFDTQFTVLSIVRQCVEFVKLYRSRPPLSSQKSSNHTAPASDEALPLVAM